MKIKLKKLKKFLIIMPIIGSFTIGFNYGKYKCKQQVEQLNEKTTVGKVIVEEIKGE